MIETTMKLVDGTGQGIVPIHEIGMDDGPDGLFTSVTDVSDSVCTGPPAWEVGVPGNRAIAGP